MMYTENKTDKLAKVIRIITVPPFLASVLVLLYLLRGGVFSSVRDVAVSVLCLTVIPLLSYPFCRAVPKLRAGGRDTQRKVAFVFSGIGYLAAVLYGFLAKGSSGMLFLYLTYLLSFLLLAAVNHLIRFKASGHSCGMIWPLIMSCVLYRLPGILVSVFLYGSALWSSVRMKRHTVQEFIAGSVICLAAAGLSAIMLGITAITAA